MAETGRKGRVLTGLLPKGPSAGARSPQRREQFFTHPGRALFGGAALLALVALFAVFVPAGPLSLDRRWSELMQDIQTPALKHLALVFDALGRGVWRGLTLAVVGLVLLALRRWAALVAFAVAEAITPLLGNLIKALVDRARPPGHMLTPHGSSFPSGHAAYASATAVALVLLYTEPGRKRLLWFALAAVVISGMAWSRTYLQVHWLSDVLAGASLGIAVTLGSFGIVQLVLNRSAGRSRRADPSEKPSRQLSAFQPSEHSGEGEQNQA